ncbi:SdrD B-like domain-containing protein, partial [Sporolactobacillus shoreae]|uniref:SdrD B-like domain-containing protein n=1 Tax=Sporolactobacillus shoreae TaxID=1465501 RepID=UPI001432CAA2
TDINGNEVKPVVTDKNGHYEFDNLPSLPTGQHYTVTIDKNASGSALTNLAPTKAMGTNDTAKDSSTWTAESTDLVKDGDSDTSLDFGFIVKSVSVGDYVWLDKNKDGVQDNDESGIAGVVLKLTGPDGKPVTDINGNEVKPVVTDKNGHYEFDNLPSLPTGQHYTVTIDKNASGSALTNLAPTKEKGTNDTAKDSSTWVAVSIDLIKDGDSDTSLDFGFIVKSVSVGDYVWLDANKNGVQDNNESGIAGVILKLSGPDGKPVTDINGNEVKTETTDKNGHYEFDDLPSLPAGEHYTVTIDKNSSALVLYGLTPTKEKGTSDQSKDSSSWNAISSDLVNDGDQDLTLDFGFMAETSVIKELPGTPGGTYNVVDQYGHVIVRGVLADSLGHVHFNGLPDGEYHLILVRGAQGESQRKNKKYAAMPATGDTNDVFAMMAGVMLLLSGGAVAFFSRRRKNN